MCGYKLATNSQNFTENILSPSENIAKSLTFFDSHCKLQPVVRPCLTGSLVSAVVWGKAVLS